MKQIGLPWLTLRRPIIAFTTYGIATEPNRRKYLVWNNHGHVTTLPTAIPDVEISEVRFFVLLTLRVSE